MSGSSGLLDLRPAKAPAQPELLAGAGLPPGSGRGGVGGRPTPLYVAWASLLPNTPCHISSSASTTGPASQNPCCRTPARHGTLPHKHRTPPPPLRVLQRLLDSPLRPVLHWHSTFILPARASGDPLGGGGGWGRASTLLVADEALRATQALASGRFISRARDGPWSIWLTAAHASRPGRRGAFSVVMWSQAARAPTATVPGF